MPVKTDNNRLETFFDGVTAIAITLLILEIRIPETGNIHSFADLRHALVSAWPSWISFLLTFLILFIAWSNHHHMAALLDKTSNAFIYANGFLLMTVVVFPFSTGFLGRFFDSGYARLPILLYCATNFIHAAAWLAVFVTALRPKDLSRDEVARQKITKTIRVVAYSCVFNLGVTLLAFRFPYPALGLVTAAWLFWLFAGIKYTSLD